MIAAIAALTAIGGAETNLTLQAHVALNAGITPAEIVAVIELTATVAGFPRAQSAPNTVRDVFALRAAVQD